jgi:hypothetical protein
MGPLTALFSAGGCRDRRTARRKPLKIPVFKKNFEEVVDDPIFFCDNRGLRFAKSVSICPI